MSLVEQPYFGRVVFPPPLLHGLDPYEMIGEKIVARNPRRGGSAEDVYDLYRWSERPFNHDLVRRIGVLKVWTRPEEGGWPESDIRETLDTKRSVYERLPADGYFLRVPGMSIST